MFDGTITEPLRHISLCSGIGGFDIGLRGIFPNMRTVVHVEGEAFCVKHLVEKMQAGQLDACPIYPDLCRFPWSEFAGAVDIITAGFPCQPFSVAGQRKATEDDRHLWPYITNGIRETKPQLVIFENVSGIASAPSPGFHSVLHNVLSDLEGLGYQATAGQFTAAEVGAPHQRKRWFIIGMADTISNSQRCISRAAGGKARGEDVGQRNRKVGPSGSAASSELANTRCDPEAARRQRQVVAEGCGTGHEQSGGGCHAGQGHIQTTGCFEGMENPNSFGPKDGIPEQARRQAVQTKSNQPAYPSQKWPMPPGPIQHEWEPPRTTEPRLGGNSDGVSNRVDRLRALGNAVVPAVVERAVRELLGRYTTN